jgi:arginyl-tRNA synthetase
MASSSKFTPLPTIPGTDPSRCVLDLFRTAIAQKLTKAFPEITLEQAYQGVDYGKKGEDFTVAIPRFRMKGKVDDLAKQVLDSVRTYPSRFAGRH